MTRIHSGHIGTQSFQRGDDSSGISRDLVMWVLRADVKGQESWQSEPKEGAALSEKFARAEGECRHIPILFVKFSTVGQDWTMIRQILSPAVCCQRAPRCPFHRHRNVVDGLTLLKVLFVHLQAIKANYFCSLGLPLIGEGVGMFEIVLRGRLHEVPLKTSFHHRLFIQFPRDFILVPALTKGS